MALADAPDRDDTVPPHGKSLDLSELEGQWL
jgi:hypothetical protein